MFYKLSVMMSLHIGSSFYAYENSFKEINQMSTKIFLTRDAQNNSIVLEYEEIAGVTLRLNEKIKNFSDILIPVYTQMEVEFAHQKPESVSNDFMLKSLAPLFEKGLDDINLKVLEEKTKSILEHFFQNTNWSSYSTVEDINIFVIAKDEKTQKILGVIQFFTTSKFERNHVKAALYGVALNAQGRDLEKILMSSIFVSRPDTKRIFLHTRSTNQCAITLYENWGFTQFKGEIPGWIDLEYVVDKSDTLQKISKGFTV